jgi:hypothetical protein
MKGKIKVIKKGTPKKAAVAVVKTGTATAAREIVANVTSWVNDFQQRQRVETKKAIETLLGSEPQANGI